VKRRLRKKKKLGEFVEWGVEVQARITPQAMIDKGIDSIMDEFVDFIEEQNMFCGGSISPNGEFDFIVELGREDGKLLSRQECLSHWLKSNPDLHKVSIGACIDLWRPPKDMC
jgi:uncharacterized protein YggL (DUF469 family)